MNPKGEEKAEEKSGKYFLKGTQEALLYLLYWCCLPFIDRKYQ
jgi:hypothetical protein